MRYQEFNEATQTKTAEPISDLDVGPSIDNLTVDTNKGDVATVDPVKNTGMKRKLPPRIKKLSKAATQQKMGNLNVTPQAAGQAAQHLSTFDATGLDGIDDSDFESPGIPEPDVESKDLAIISKEIGEFKGVEPEFIEVKDLPGYMQQGLRQLGRAVFSQFTTEKIENISVVTSLTHSEDEVNAVGSWATKNGQKLDTAHIDFSAMEDYEADMQLWANDGYEFLFVKDFAGKYIYTWKANTSKVAGTGSSAQIGNQKQIK